MQNNPSMMKTPSGTSGNSAAHLVNNLFRRLRAIKPGWKAAFRNQEEYDTAKSEWTKALIQAGISDWAVIEWALDELRQQPGPFIPSTGDFIALCRKAQLNDWRVPAEAEAFAMLQRFFGPRHIDRDFTKLNPAVYAAYRKMDWSAVSQLPTRFQRKSFSEVWEQVLDDIQRGRTLPKAVPPERRIEQQDTSGTETNRKTAEETLAALKAEL